MTTTRYSKEVKTFLGTRLEIDKSNTLFNIMHCVDYLQGEMR